MLDFTYLCHFLEQNSSIVWVVLAAALILFLIYRWLMCDFGTKHAGIIEVAALAAVFTSSLSALVAFLSYNATRDETAYLHRPHFQLRFANIDGYPDELFRSGSRVNVHLDLLNDGQFEANVFASHLEVFWSNRGLPGNFPYYPDEAHPHLNQSVCQNVSGKCTVGAGSGGPQMLKVTSDRIMGPEASKIATGEDGWHMYLVGWIAYRGPWTITIAISILDSNMIRNGADSFLLMMILTTRMIPRLDRATEPCRPQAPSMIGRSTKEFSDLQYFERLQHAAAMTLMPCLGYVRSRMRGISCPVNTIILASLLSTA